MLLSNEFVVAADVDTVWRHLLDMEEVAECVPGAKVEEVVPPNIYRGKIRLKIGPMTVEYRGEATLVEVDEDARRATVQMKAREARGQGSALATVRNSLAAVPEGTRVRAETELEITGPQAQFGKGVLEDVGGRILEEFTARLERRIAAAEQGSGAEASSVNGAGSSRGPDRSGPVGTGPSASSEDDTLDLNRVLASSLRERGLKAGAVVAAVLAAVAAIWRWRRRARSKP
jgi:carbon monoxide dehydrogenase subunit G